MNKYFLKETEKNKMMIIKLIGINNNNDSYMRYQIRQIQNIITAHSKFQTIAKVCNS